jgi:hypothetical protein
MLAAGRNIRAGDLRAGDTKQATLLIDTYKPAIFFGGLVVCRAIRLLGERAAR